MERGPLLAVRHLSKFFTPLTNSGLHVCPPRQGKEIGWGQEAADNYQSKHSGWPFRTDSISNFTDVINLGRGVSRSLCLPTCADLLLVLLEVGGDDGVLNMSLLFVTLLSGNVPQCGSAAPRQTVKRLCLPSEMLESPWEKTWPKSYQHIKPAIDRGRGRHIAMATEIMASSWRRMVKRQPALTPSCQRWSWLLISCEGE